MCSYVVFPVTPNLAKKSFSRAFSQSLSHGCCGGSLLKPCHKSCCCPPSRSVKLNKTFVSERTVMHEVKGITVRNINSEDDVCVQQEIRLTLLMATFLLLLIILFYLLPLSMYGDGKGKDRYKRGRQA